MDRLVVVVEVEVVVEVLEAETACVAARAFVAPVVVVVGDARKWVSLLVGIGKVVGFFCGRYGLIGEEKEGGYNVLKFSEVFGSICIAVTNKTGLPVVVEVVP